MQDWFTSLSFSHPELFYELPCRFNRQTSVQLLQGDTEAVFEAHHACEPASEVVILHSNGCGHTAASRGPPSYTGTCGRHHATWQLSIPNNLF